MNTREKAAFLRAEGWKRKNLKFEAGYPARLHWVDSHGTAQWCLWDAFSIASRRKAQRETRRLKAAGWTCEKRDQWIRFADGFDFAGLGKMCTVYTRAEALKQLGIK